MNSNPNPNEFNVNETMARVVNLSLERSATAVFDKIKSVKANNDNKKTISILEDMINDLLDDKRELINIARSYESEFVSKKITKEDLNKITQDIIPALTTFIDQYESDEVKKEENLTILNSLEPLLSTEVLDILQTIGFNYKEALGEPLTELTRKAILKNAETTNSDYLKLQIAQKESEIELQKTLQDEGSYQRLLDWASKA